MTEAPAGFPWGEALRGRLAGRRLPDATFRRRETSSREQNKAGQKQEQRADQAAPYESLRQAKNPSTWEPNRRQTPG